MTKRLLRKEFTLTRKYLGERRRIPWQKPGSRHGMLIRSSDGNCCSCTYKRQCKTFWATGSGYRDIFADNAKTIREYEERRDVSMTMPDHLIDDSNHNIGFLLLAKLIQ